jgi:chorismate mutase
MEPTTPILPVEKWADYKKRPLLIAGPCSAETEEQVINTARELAAIGEVNIFRAGLWKPRTRPGTFEGVGSLGLPWLKRVQQETGMPVATEVANAKHVYEALKYGIDYIWIGARSSANPFVVQEIAESLEGAKVGVLIKNPVNPDLDLWIGAIERVRKAGVTRIAAIHRGFSNYEKTQYRNIPHWQLAVDLKQQFPELPMICDPSHITGNASMLYDVSQKSMDLNYDGLMIETHIDPENAWSDAAQQVTPNELREIISRLIMRSPVSTDKGFLDVLGELRSQIDLLDDQLLNIMEQRMNVAKTIAKYKKDNSITILQTRRWNEIVKKSVAKGESKGLSSEFVENMFKAIHTESISHQTRVMNSPETIDLPKKQ